MTTFPPILPISILAFDGVQLLDVSGPLQVFASCNDLLTERGAAPRYAARVVTIGGGACRSSAGLILQTDDATVGERPIDTLLVAGGFGVHGACEDSAITDWLLRQARTSRRVASVCTGAFLLAAAGLLDGRRVTTHWQHGARLAEKHPDIVVDCDPIFIGDGTVWTSAGVSAGIDLALDFVSSDVDRETALAVARRLVVYLQRPGGQSQFSHALAAQGTPRFVALHEWIRAHLHLDLRVPVLAEQAGMSERHFARVYTAETGSTPAVAVERFRVEAARRAIEGRAPLARAARAGGFRSLETMRRGFLRTLGVTPGAYRRCFCEPVVATREATQNVSRSSSYDTMTWAR